MTPKPTTDQVIPVTDVWLLMKRGLYYRPDQCGYTGIRNLAARYSGPEARALLSPGVSMIRLDAAKEFTNACFHDLAREHLRIQRDGARAEVERLRAALQEIADQRQSTDMDETELELADFEGGFDVVVAKAREALGVAAPSTSSIEPRS